MQITLNQVISDNAGGIDIAARHNIANLSVKGDVPSREDRSSKGKD